MIGNAVIILSVHQRHLLWRALAEIIAFGECAFELEACIGHHSGHTISWESDGSPEQEDDIDRVLTALAQAIHDG